LEEVKTKKPLYFLLAFVLIWLAFYFALEFYTSKKISFISLDLPYENLIPQIPFFFIIYLLAYPVALLPFILFNEKKILKRILTAYLLITLISSVIYIFFPTEITRLPLNLENFYDKLLFYFRKIDTNQNLFPSFHAGLVFLSTFICNLKYKKLGKILYLLSFIIVLSTLFIKQHYILDLIFGFLLASIIFRLVFKKTYKENSSQN